MNQTQTGKKTPWRRLGAVACRVVPVVALAGAAAWSLLGGADAASQAAPPWAPPCWLCAAGPGNAAPDLFQIPTTPRRISGGRFFLPFQPEFSGGCIV